MAWPYSFTSVQNATGAMLDANFNAAGQLGTDVTFSGIDNTPIGATTPAPGMFTTLNVSARVSVSFSTANSITATQTGGASANAFVGNLSNTTSAFLLCEYNGTVVGSITTNGSATAYNTTSDANLKAIHGLADGSPLSSLPVRDASFLADPTIRHPMLIAQEVAAVAPYAVREPAAGSTDPCMIDLSKLVPAMLAYIQGCEARIAALEATAKIAAPALTPAAMTAASAVAAITGGAVIQAAIARGAAGAPPHGPSIVSPTP